ncbi:hypothetical protein CSTERLE_07080 [Thermoclostridium stercorarium subsp. leptospartum DSM 9219]|jgi:tetratricopeptide (TPR) repeat protein|uniref:Uncharacterized protein n=1 Tax=Thermoclostridium stercorarium subsp. leptospartum DSM 9219 TaxID=1346611 RepID=A0A1B1YKN2_THEST|nr:tetratricopeptide repeat protein [Thermoclostridium stercorarium]ANX01347.1 hypothetical protein CSTERLE_07080 [Thermoclostridium stercorarium subsp. leptospartum DSM 9219]
MNISLVFVAFVVSFLTIYMMHRFVKRPGVFLVFVLIIQFLSATVVIFSLLEDVFTIPEVELAVIVGGVLLPSLIVVYDHAIMIRKIRKTGIDIRLIESRKKNNTQQLDYLYFLENAELYGNEIEAPVVFKSLEISDGKLSKNIKKQLLTAGRLIKFHKLEAAASQYRLLFSIFPDSVYIAYNLGYLYCLTGKYRQACKTLRKAMFLVKNNARAKNNNSTTVPYDRLEALIDFNLGYAFYRLGKFEFAIKYFEKVLDIAPDLTAAYKNIARAYLALGLEDSAVTYLEKGRADAGDTLLRTVLGIIYYKKGETGKAYEVLDEVVVNEARRLEALKYKGKAALKEKMFEKAEGCFKKLIEFEPEEPLNYYHLALAQRELKRNHDALRTYQKGISVSPNNSMLLYNAATLLDEMGDKERAIHYLYRALEGDEQSEDVYNYLGVLLGRMGRYAEAVQVFDKGIKLYEKSYRLYFNRGVVLELSRRFEDAEYSFEKAYELNKRDQELIYHYAAVLIKLRRFDKALKIYKASLSSFPDDVELYYGLSTVYAHMGEKDLAVDLLRKVLEADPSYKTRILNDSSFKILSRHEDFKSLTAS